MRYSKTASALPIILAVSVILSRPGIAAADDFDMSAVMKEGIEKTLQEATSDPDQLNALLDRVTSKGPAHRLLHDLDFRFKTFDSMRDGDAAHLGFEYAYDKSMKDRPLGGADGSMSLSFNLDCEGNVAFDQEVNPNDFLKSGVKLYLAGFHNLYDLPPVDTLVADRLQAAIVAAAGCSGDAEEIDRCPAWIEFLDRLNEDYVSMLGTDVFWDVALDASLESNQDFSSRQVAYGAEAVFVPRSLNPSSTFSRLNLFDYPFALVRWLTGLDPRFRASGQAFPSLLVGLDRVDPGENDARRAIPGGEDPFNRLRGEIAVKSKVAALGGEPIWFHAGWRYYRELSASKAIEAARLDEHSFLAAGIDLPNGFFVTYATGKLPLDARNDDVWETGFKFGL